MQIITAQKNQIKIACCGAVVLSSTDRASDKAKSQAEQEMGDLGIKHVQDSFIRLVYEMKGISTSFLHHILLARFHGAYNDL